MRPVNSLKTLLFPYENIELVAQAFCQRLQVTVTKSSIQKQLQEHPDYPSLLAVSDILKNVGINNAAFETKLDDLDNFPKHFIAEIKTATDTSYSIVTIIDANTIEYNNTPNNTATIVSLDDFNKVFTGKVILAEEPEVPLQEPNYKQLLREEKRKTATSVLMSSIIPLLVVVECIVVFSKYQLHALASIVYTLITLAGTIVGSLLLWYEIDKHNPVLQQICSGSKKTNCNAVLSSSASKIFGISWSVIGFTYFAGSLISLLVSGIYNSSMLFILSWLNILGLPYIIFSIYYQSRIAKQWCVLCLSVQLLLALQFVTSSVGKFYYFSSFSAIGFSTVLVFLISLAIY